VGSDDANAGGVGGAGEGGGLYFAGAGGTGMIVDSTEFSSNRAIGGAGGAGGQNTLVPKVGAPLAGVGGAGGDARGGGLLATGSSPHIAGTFSQNTAAGGVGGDGGQNSIQFGQGGDGGDGGYGSGGGLFLSPSGLDTTINALISGNTARGGVAARAPRFQVSLSG